MVFCLDLYFIIIAHALMAHKQILVKKKCLTWVLLSLFLVYFVRSSNSNSHLQKGKQLICQVCIRASSIITLEKLQKLFLTPVVIVKKIWISVLFIIWIFQKLNVQNIPILFFTETVGTIYSLAFLYQTTKGTLSFEVSTVIRLFKLS